MVLNLFVHYRPDYYVDLDPLQIISVDNWYTILHILFIAHRFFFFLWTTNREKPCNNKLYIYYSRVYVTRIYYYIGPGGNSIGCCWLSQFYVSIGTIL